MDAKKEILVKKFYDRVEQGNNTAKPHLLRIGEDGKLLNDFIVGLGNKEGMNSVVGFGANGGVKMYIPGNENTEAAKFTLHTNAISQIGEKFGTPPAYLKNLAGGAVWQKELCADILNKTNRNNDYKRVLVREVAGEVRGVLSDKYRRLDTNKLFESFILGCRAKEMVVWDAFAGDLESHVEFISKDIIDIPLKDGLTESVVFGAKISNGDFGTRSLTIQTYIIKVVCLNGMTRNNLLRQVHLGSKLSDDLIFSKQTYELDTQTMSSAVMDIVQNVITKERIIDECSLIQKAANTEISYEAEFIKLNKTGKINKAETEEINNVLIGHRMEDGIIGEGSNLWNLTNGITAVSRSKTGERKRELEEIAGALLENVK